MTEQRNPCHVNGSDVSLTTGHADSGDYTWDDGDELADFAPYMTNDEYTLTLEQKLHDAVTRLAAYERNSEGMGAAAWMIVATIFALGIATGAALTWLISAVLP